MKYFITGGTGYIGKHLIDNLLKEGDEVTALVRAGSRNKIAQDHSKLSLIEGDLLNKKSLWKGMKDTDYVIHLAAFASVWAPSDQKFYEVNVEGTRNVLEAAFEIGVKKVIHTSTAGVFGNSSRLMVKETTPRNIPFFNIYERTKYEAELVVQDYVNKGLNVVILNPSRVFGYGEINIVTKMIKGYVDGSWRYIPGRGNTIGNYVFIEDVVKAFSLAIEKGASGEQYIIGGENLSFNQFFNCISKTTGVKRNMLRIPFTLIDIFAFIELWKAKIVGIAPIITPGWIKKYKQDAMLSSEKAQIDLGYTYTPFSNAIKKTLHNFY